MIMDALRKRMKTIIYVIVVAFVATGALVYLRGPRGGNSQQEAYAQRSDRPVATVNGEEISYQEYSYQLNGYLRQYQNQISSNQVVGLKSRVLNNLINQELILQAAEKNGINPEISEETIQEQLDQAINKYASSKEEFEKIIKKNGQTIEDVKNTIKNSMTMQKRIEGMLAKVKADVKITEEEIAKEYEEVTASHILIKTDDKDDKDDKEAKEKAEKVLKLAKAGNDFTELAKEYSEGPSASRGGELGSFGHGKMVPAFEKAAFAMKVGEVSDLVKTEFGYHIIKVTDKKVASGEEFNSKKEEIRKKLLSQKESEAINQWIEETRDDSKVIIKDKEINAFTAAQEGDLKTAIKDYKAAIKANSGSYYLYHNLADAYQRNGNQEDVISTYQEAINKYPEQVDFYMSLANIYQKEEKFDKAVEVYEQGLTNNQDNAELHLGLGDLYRAQDKTDEAVVEYEKFSKLSGDNLMAHYRLARVYSQMGLEDKSKAEMEKLKEIQKKKQEQVKEEREEENKVEETKTEKN
ncbi:peptidylprolyl isomerase [Orenia marismortui]|uniref:peptidylprolyl isomerase n=1 Tax=Orenia marismortui TaxID=46469 RepID=UPI000371E6C5|nr:peptidylprolyl isomerase [Orenia marismortui]